MTRASFYEHPELYDLLFAPELPVVEFYAQQATRAGGPVLELGCGTGRVLVPIAQRGVEVIGLDLSPAMLAYARKEAEAAGARVQLVQGDMRDFDLKRRFALVYVASNSLSHLADRASLRGFFRAAKNHLALGGRLVFDVGNPDLRTLDLPADERRPRDPVTHSEWGELSVEERSEYDAATQIATLYFGVRAARQQVFALRLRNFFPCELELLLELDGFALLERFGDFNGSPFTSTSPHQVCVCQPLAAAGA